jgi:hypothetical protein
LVVKVLKDSTETQEQLDLLEPKEPKELKGQQELKEPQML